MFKQLSSAWRRFRQGRPGRRFQDQREHLRWHRGLAGWHRALLALLGVALIAAGVILMFLPGPGALIAALGLVLLSQILPSVGPFLDRSELLMRDLGRRGRAWWAGAPFGLRLLITVALGALVGIGGYLLYRWLGHPLIQMVADRQAAAGPLCDNLRA